jgi:hypothetical protein
VNAFTQWQTAGREHPVFLADRAWHPLMLLASVVGNSLAAAAGACLEHLANARVRDVTPVEERRPPS